MLGEILAGRDAQFRAQKTGLKNFHQAGRWSGVVPGTGKASPRTDAATDWSRTMYAARRCFLCGRVPAGRLGVDAKQ